VIYAQPIDGLLMDVRSTGLVTIAITLGALLIALLVAQLLAHSIVRPVRELAAAAERVGAGDLHTPIPAAGNDEIGALGRTLRHTVGRLRESLHLAEQGLQEAETLRAATRALSSTLARDEVLQLILSELQKVVPYDSASVQVLEGNSTTIIGTYGLAWHESIVGMRFALDDPKSPNGEVVRSRAPLILDDAPARFALFHSEPFSGDSIRSWLGVPMIFGAHVIGVITLDKREPGFYKADHARLAADFAAHAAIAMENARLYAAAQQELNERQRAEEELRQAQKMEALGRLAGGLAHDFNNLLTVILGETDMLLDDMARDHPDRPAVEQIRQSGARAAALTRQLLAFSRRQMLQAERVNLNDVIVGMEQLLRRLIGEDVSLTIALAHNLPDVRADRSQMEQVLMNLVINARDAMPEGGHLLIETTATTLTAEDARAHSEVVPGFYAMLAVTDTGSGMDETTRAHIFEPFFTTKPRGKGTGLGLATVHGIVRQSGGQIWFHSEPDRGSTFNICLPAVVDAIAEPVLPQLPEPTPRSAAAETVLLVEDDEHVRSLTRVLLLRAGFTVLEASDGPAALALVRSEPGSIALLLTDVIMPGGLNGVQLARAVRTLRPAIGVVYMSGYTDNAHVDQSLVEDGARYLQKPFTLDALVESVLAALAKGETGRV
jgi:signal transduction histidine kinase/ActR/RegA family two-component response regulator